MRPGSLAATFALGVAVLAAPASALILERVERRCPIDGTSFDSTVALSGSSFCLRLDLKRVGPIADPPLLHECPEDGFVWYDHDFSTSDVASLREWVRSDEYAALARNESRHHRLARLYERLGRDAWTISTAYRHAAWEVEKHDAARYERDLRQSLSHLLREIQGRPRTSPATAESEIREILAGELERQLGDFESAAIRFLVMRDAGGFREASNGDVVRYELELIAAHDRKPRYVPSERTDEAACLRWDPSPRS